MCVCVCVCACVCLYVYACKDLAPALLWRHYPLYYDSPCSGNITVTPLYDVTVPPLLCHYPLYYYPSCILASTPPLLPSNMTPQLKIYYIYIYIYIYIYNNNTNNK